MNEVSGGGGVFLVLETILDGCIDLEAFTLSDGVLIMYRNFSYNFVIMFSTMMLLQCIIMLDQQYPTLSGAFVIVENVIF